MRCTGLPQSNSQCAKECRALSRGQRGSFGTAAPAVRMAVRPAESGLPTCAVEYVPQLPHGAWEDSIGGRRTRGLVQTAQGLANAVAEQHDTRPVALLPDDRGLRDVSVTAHPVPEYPGRGTDAQPGREQ